MKQDNELWVKALRERLADYAETPPPVDWEAIETALKPPMKRSFGLTPYRAVAAVVLLLIASGAFYYFFVTNPKAPLHYSEDLIELHIPDEAINKTLPDASGVDVSPYLIPFSLWDMQQSVAETEASIVSDTIVVNRNEQRRYPESETYKEALAVAEEKESRKISKPSAKDKLHPLVRGEKQTQSWSVMASIGNAAGLAKNDNSQLLVTSAMPGSSSGVNLPTFFRQRELYDVSHRLPISFGVTVRKAITSHVAIESGLIYTLLSSEGKQGNSSKKIEQKLHYIGIPLRGSVSVMRRDRFQVYLNAGGMVEKCIYAEIGGEKQNVNQLQLSLLGGVGLQYELTKRLGLYIEPGVSYYFDDGSDMQTIRKENKLNFTMQAGVRLSY